MPLKKVSHEELSRQVFLALADRWDLKDREGSLILAEKSWEIAGAYLEMEQEKLQASKPKSPSSR
jgi:hypothetical protein